ncbi:MAG: PD-(D/E)XK nuclease family protein [Thermoplasmataceae archaeon]
MTGILDRSKIGDLVTQARTDTNISQIINKALTASAQHFLFKDYFFVTDLVNPAYYYWQVANYIPNPNDIQKKLDYGTHIHRISRYWLEKIPGFVYSESSLVGNYVGLDKISGKIDYQVADSIIELKTKERAVSSIDNVLDDFPHDLEQLLTYVAISSSVGNKHFLVFVHPGANNGLDFTAFQVTVNNLQGVRSKVIQRRELLEKALTDKNNSRLPRCRYFDEGCKFKLAKICNCGGLVKEDARDYLRFIDIQLDQEFAKSVRDAYQNNPSVFSNSKALELWDLIFPMKKYHKNFDYYIDEDYEFASDFQNSAIRATVSDAIRRSGLAVTGKELESLRRVHAFGFGGQCAFVKVYVPNISQNPIPSPFTVKVSKASNPFTETRLPNIYYAQAVLMAVDSGSNCAVLFVSYPNSGDRVIVYVICADKDNVAKTVRSEKTRLDESIRNGDPSTLERCPDWVRNTCSFGACYCKTD